MSRDIKFRAWEKNLKQIIPVYNIDFKSQMINKDAAWRLFDEVELMQYTGLKDKNDKEICKGDILEFVAVGTKWVVGFRNSAFVISHKNSNVNILYDCAIEDGILTHMKVIGNIYENPELLKEA